MNEIEKLERACKKLEKEWKNGIPIMIASQRKELLKKYEPLCRHLWRKWIEIKKIEGIDL